MQIGATHCKYTPDPSAVPGLTTHPAASHSISFVSIFAFSRHYNMSDWIPWTAFPSSKLGGGSLSCLMFAFLSCAIRPKVLRIMHPYAMHAPRILQSQARSSRCNFIDVPVLSPQSLELCFSPSAQQLGTCMSAHHDLLVVRATLCAATGSEFGPAQMPSALQHVSRII